MIGLSGSEKDFGDTFSRFDTKLDRDKKTDGRTDERFATTTTHSIAGLKSTERSLSALKTCSRLNVQTLT